MYYRHITDPGQACSGAQAVLSRRIRDTGYIIASILNIGRSSEGNELSK